MIVEKSLEEVWTWKDAVYNDTKNMSKDEELNYFKEKTDSFLKSLGFKKKLGAGNTYKLDKEG
jgi:hypothetical protein